MQKSTVCHEPYPPAPGRSLCSGLTSVYLQLTCITSSSYIILPAQRFQIDFWATGSVGSISVTTLCSTRSGIRARLVYHLSFSGPIYPSWTDRSVRHGFRSDLTRLHTEIRSVPRSGLVLERCLSGGRSSCCPGVWTCVAPPSCLNRSLLKELARLPTNPAHSFTAG